MIPLSGDRLEAIRQFRMDELEAVMLSVDKWLDYADDDPNRPNPATRAAEAREVALQAIEKLQAELARLRAETERLKQSIWDFNRNDHDERGAAETWHDCYLEQKARAEQAEAARAALESEVKRLKPLAELIAKDRTAP